MSQPIHILQVAKSTGGVGTYVRWLAHGIDHERYRLTVACLSEGGPELAAELGALAGVRAFSVAMERYRLDPRSDLRVLGELAGLLRRERFDLIHAHTSKPGFLARLAALGSGVPVIYSPHGFAFHGRAGRLRTMYSLVLERIAARALTARIVAVCDDERDLGLHHGVGRPGQIITIHTGIDPLPFTQPVDRAALRAGLGVPADAPLAGIVGRLTPQKAPLDLVRAAAHVHAALPEAHFVWVGDGPLEGEVRALIAAEGLGGVLHLAGMRHDVPALLQVLDLFVLPSRWEGFSISVLEAMAAGLPVVATRVTGAAEAVAHAESGLLVPSGDTHALAVAILDLLSDPERAQAYGLAGRRRIERQFTRERMIGLIADLYDEVAAMRPDRRPGRQVRRV